MKINKTLKLIIITTIFIGFKEVKAQWVYQNINSFKSIYQIECLDSIHCFCAGENGTIKKTTDGINWTDASAGISDTNYIFNLKCFDNNTCYGQGGYTFIKTNDGGLNWEVTDLGFYASEMVFPSPMVGYMISPFEGTIYKTLDGGVTWSPLPTTLTNIESFGSIFFLDENTGILSCREQSSNVAMYKTINGGGTWTKIYDVAGSIYSPNYYRWYIFRSEQYLCLWFTGACH